MNHASDYQSINQSTNHTDQSFQPHRYNTTDGHMIEAGSERVELMPHCYMVSKKWLVTYPHLVESASARQAG